MRRVVVLSVVGFLSVVFPMVAAAEATTLAEVSRTSSSGVTTSPCTGEPIAFTTNVTSVFHYVLNPTGVARISSVVTLSGTATGLTTGTSYVLGGASHVYSPFDPVFPQEFPVTSTLTFLLVSSGGAPNLIQHQVLLLHFNAAGEPTVDLNQSTFECAG
jgi:hypothetical protein